MSAPPAKRRQKFGESVRNDQAVQDRIQKLAGSNWLPQPPPIDAFKSELVNRIYSEEILGSGFSQRRSMHLEFSRYLEHYLWPNYNPNQPGRCSRGHLLSIVVIVNEKCRERVPSWRAFRDAPDHFPGFFRQILQVSLEEATLTTDKDQLQEQIILVIFLTHCFNSLAEEGLIRDQLKRVLSLGMWSSLLAGRRESELATNDKYRRLYRALMKRDAKAEGGLTAGEITERGFLPRLLDSFLTLLASIKPEAEEPSTTSPLVVHYLERCVLLFIDLESMLLTRRYFNTVLDDRHSVVRCRLLPLASRPEGKLFNQLVDMLAFYTNFEIEDSTGEALSQNEVDKRHCERVLALQRTLFVSHGDRLRSLCVANVGSVEKEETLTKQLKTMETGELHQLAASLHLVDKEGPNHTEQFLIKLLVHRFAKSPSQLSYINSLPLYPTEEVIWDENRVPMEHYSGGECLALPKLSLQFLTLHDYLLRNFNLFHLESTYQIRQDVEDSVSRLKPWQTEMGETVFGGWSRMAMPLTNFSIIEVGKPQLGAGHPSRVRADISVTLSTRQDVKREWESLRRYDPCFLITVRPQVPYGYKYNFREPFLPQSGLLYVRGCEVEGLVDLEGKVMTEEERSTALPALQASGDLRTWRVKLDPCQYQMDMERTTAALKEGTIGAEDVYDTFNILLRRKPKENNFKAVLETIRDLMNTRCVVPEWLHDLLLGYEDPSSAHYSQMKEAYQPRQDWRDTFLDGDHVRASFPQYQVQLVDRRRKYDLQAATKNPSSKKTTDSQAPPPPYRLIFPSLTTDTSFPSKKSDITGDTAPPPPLLTVEAYSPPFRPPQLVSALGVAIKGNAVRFTPTQVEAIRAGMQPGLTMVVGPPGTGKTDVAVQIIHNIYHNYPNQRTLIVTHSNQALNQLFEKIIALDINERHLLRLGHGEEGLDTEKDFSRYGRVNYVLARRLNLLADVDRLAASLGEGIGTTTTEANPSVTTTSAAPPKDGEGDKNMPTYTSETAQHFFLHVVLARWEAFLAIVTAASSSTEGYDPVLIRDHFPFMEFFMGTNITPEKKATLFPGASLNEDLAISRSCFLHLENVFSQLDEFRAFELMRTGVERSNYLLVQEAKVIAMTCTHAALRRRDLVDLGFTYDNILMEEAAQILEIETFIPLLLQNPDMSNLNRLKRWVMIGDHHQLPPVVKNMAFQNLCNMGQSLFARLVKLGVPVVQLDAQGRARPSLARLYSWRYDRLDDLPHVAGRPEFRRSNPGFALDYQLIDVQDFEGVGESEPSPYFYQNLAEAEYLVNVYMYMRLLGYPAERISVITTYNGQKHLIRDVIANRCANNPLIGQPSKVTTVDRFQGQQNDYILLSLVRTRTVGHLRDVRRLVVAMSRARLGLYVFGRASLFSACHELRPTLHLLTSRPLQLHLRPWEAWQQQGRGGQGQRPAKLVQDMPDMANFVYEFYNHRLAEMMAERQRLDKWRGSKRPPAALPQPPRRGAQTTITTTSSGGCGTTEVEAQTTITTTSGGTTEVEAQTTITTTSGGTTEVEAQTPPLKKKQTEEDGRDVEEGPTPEKRIRTDEQLEVSSATVEQSAADEETETEVVATEKVVEGADEPESSEVESRELPFTS